MTAAPYNAPGGFVPQLTRAWVRLYCGGMSSQARAVRRLEIESDLWEHYADRSAARAAPAATGLEAFSRLLRGVPSDIAWRFQAEGFHMNINFPVERIAGLLLLLLIAPFLAGTAIAGYDLRAEYWSDEFARFSDIPTWQRDVSAALHAALGVLLVAAASQAWVALRERSARIVTLGTSLLTAAGVVMLANAAAYRGMSALADDYAANPDASLLAAGRALGHIVETLALTHMAATVCGVLLYATALVRLGMVPRWTIALPSLGVAAPFLWMGLDAAFGDVGWLAMIVGMMAILAWLLICGVWLLFGGSTRYSSMKGVPAHAG